MFNQFRRAKDMSVTGVAEKEETEKSLDEIITEYEEGSQSRPE